MTHDAAMNTVECLTRHFEIGPATASWPCRLWNATCRCWRSSRRCGSAVRSSWSTKRSGAIPMPGPGSSTMHKVSVLNFMPGWLEMLIEVGAARPVVTARGARRRRLGAPGSGAPTEAQAPDVRFAGLGGATETAIHARFSSADRAAGRLDGGSLWRAVSQQRLPGRRRCRAATARTGWSASCGYRDAVSRGVTAGRPDLTAQRFVDTRRAGRGIAPATWRGTGRTARWSSSDAPTTGSKSAATASNSARSRPRCDKISGVAVGSRL